MLAPPPGNSSTNATMDPEGTAMLPPPPGNSSTNATTTAAANTTNNGTCLWKGCMLAQQAYAAGDVVLQGADNPQPSAEACCRSCASFAQGTGCGSTDGYACNM